MSVAEQITRLNTAKADIKTAIEAKGVTVPSTAKIDVYDDYIAQIQQGEDQSEYWTHDWQFKRPAEWPDLDIFDMENNYGVVATYDCRDRIADPVHCRDYFAVGSHNTLTYVVERGTVINGEFVVRNTVTLNQTATYSELLPTNEGDYVVYRITTPSWPSTNTNFRFRLTSSNTNAAERASNGDSPYHGNKILELLINCKVCDVNILPYSQVLKHLVVYNGGSSDRYVYLQDASHLEYMDFSGQTLGKLEGAFRGCANLKKINFISATTNITSLYSAFENCRLLKELDISNLQFSSSAIGCLNAFAGCVSLSNIDFSDKTIIAGTIAGMFNGCTTLKSVNISTISTPAVPSFYQLFANCYSLTDVNIGNMDFSAATNMGRMFYYNKSLTFCPLSGKSLPTGNVTTFGAMFEGCSNLREMDMRGWDFTKITSAGGTGTMFTGCSKLTMVAFPSTTSILNNTFLQNCFNLSTIICMATVPPTWGGPYNTTFNPNYKIYVPDASVDTYKTATGWLNGADHIYGISTYTGD